MQISATHDFPQPPDAAFTMLLDPEFLAAVCVATHPLEYRVFSEGLHTGARRVMPSPSVIQRFSGPTLTVADEIRWDEAAAGQPRTGTTLVTVDGMPVRLSGRVALAARGAGSTLTYTGELTVSIPLVGPGLERQAAPLLLEALAVQSQVAQTWG